MQKGKEKKADLWKEGLVLVGRQVIKEARGGEERIKIMGVIMGVVVGVIVGKLFVLQVMEGKKNAYLVKNHSLRMIRDKELRGVIYDREGKVLARNVEVGEGKVGREYPLGPAAAHVVGYVGEVSKEELSCKESRCLLPGEIVGKMGVERSLDDVLRGVEGGRIVEVDARGEVVRELGRIEGEAGKEVVLSIDSQLQNIAWQALKKKLADEGSGSVVALDMQGKVLALVSYPSFDSNLLTIRRDNKVIQELLNNRKRQYFLNRVISGVYPPGSVFKPVVALAGLETGVLSKDETIEDVGKLTVNGYEYTNWYYTEYGKTEGKIDVVRALARSNDIFFYKLGERLGVKRIDEWAKKMGLGEKTGVELGGESEGLVPTPLWKERYKGKKWFLGDTYNISIGQGDLLVTPLQVAAMIEAVVSGRRCQVSVLKDKAVECQDLGIKEENRKVVLEGMREACKQGGTGFTFFDFKPEVLCKTGTAEQGGKNVEPHAWMAVVYPGDNPRMVLVVMLERAGEGSRQAGGVAREILDEYKSKVEKGK